jgi:hypothetical protein
MLAMNGCKKTETIQPVSTNDLTQNQKNAIDKLREKVRNNPKMAALVFPINKKVPTHFEDKWGNTITGNSASLTNSFVYQCLPADEMDYPPSAGLVQLTRLYDCSYGYQFTITWSINTSINLISSSGSSLSRGRLRLKDIYGATINNTSITPVTITLTGDDPFTTNHLYTVSYTTPWLSASLFTPNTVSMEHSLVVYTDCPDAISIVTPYAAASNGLDISTPCNRVDLVPVHNAQIGSGGVYITNGDVDGFGNVTFMGGCPSPATYADRQQVQLRCVVSGVTDTWRDITPQQGTSGSAGELNPFNSTTQHGTIGKYDYYFIPDRDLYLDPTSGLPVHGAYEVQYRNVMYPLGSGCTGDWSPIVSASF